MNAITKTQISQYAKPKRINLRTQRYEDGTGWIYLKTYPYIISGLRLLSRTVQQNKRTRHLIVLSPRTGTCDVIFMAAVADTKRNFNACYWSKNMKKKTTVTFSRPKTLQNLIYSGQNSRNVSLKLWRPVTLFRQCSLEN